MSFLVIALLGILMLILLGVCCKLILSILNLFVYVGGMLLLIGLLCFYIIIIYVVIRYIIRSLKCYKRAPIDIPDTSFIIELEIKITKLLLCLSIILYIVYKIIFTYNLL